MKLQLLLIMTFVLGITSCTSEVETAVVEDEAVARVGDDSTTQREQAECIGVQCLPCFKKKEGCSSARTDATNKLPMPVETPQVAATASKPERPRMNFGFVMNHNHIVRVFRPNFRELSNKDISYEEKVSLEGMELIDVQELEKSDLNSLTDGVPFSKRKAIMARAKKPLREELYSLSKKIDMGLISGIFFYKRSYRSKIKNRFEYKIVIKLRDELMNMWIKINIQKLESKNPYIVENVHVEDKIDELVSDLDPWKGIRCKPKAGKRVKTVYLTAGTNGNSGYPHEATDDFDFFISDDFVGQTRKGFNEAGYNQYVLASFDLEKYKGRIACASMQYEIQFQQFVSSTDGVAIFRFPAGSGYNRYDCSTKYTDPNIHCGGNRFYNNAASVQIGNVKTFNQDLSNLNAGNSNIVDFVQEMNEEGSVHTWIQDDMIAKRVTLAIKVYEN